MSIFQQLVNHKKKIELSFFIFECLILSLLPIGFFVYRSDILAYENFRLLGIWLGRFSFLLFALTLLPGIMRRFGQFPLIQARLMMFRRHLGIVMFTMALAHFGLVFSIPLVASGQPFPSSVPVKIIFGQLSIFLLMPLWLTSNDLSQKVLKRKWQLLHRLVYVASLTIFGHIAFFNPYIAIFALLLFILEISSFGYKYFTNRARD